MPFEKFNPKLPHSAVPTPRARLRQIPKTGSKEFPKVFKLGPHLVGFSVASRFMPLNGIEISLLPVGKRNEHHARFLNGHPKQKFAASVDSLSQTPVRRPVLAKGLLSVVPKEERSLFPKELQKTIGKKSVGEIGYEIMEPYRKGKSPDLSERGIGSAIVSELVEQAKVRGIGVLVARIINSNSASPMSGASEKILLKNGFELINEPQLFLFHPTSHTYYYCKKM